MNSAFNRSVQLRRRKFSGGSQRLNDKNLRIRLCLVRITRLTVMLTGSMPTKTDTSEIVIPGSKTTRTGWWTEMTRIAQAFDISRDHSTHLSKYALLWKQTQTDFSITFCQS